MLDLSTIDLTQVLVSGDEVGRINPQSGAMRHLDHVIWMNPERTHAVGVKHVRDDEFWVEGHIPGRPLLPGVLMIEAAAQLSSVLFRHKVGEMRFLGFTRCDDVVFRGQVVPGDTLYLITHELDLRPRRFRSYTQGVVDGKLVYEGTVTGMVL